MYLDLRFLSTVNQHLSVIPFFNQTLECPVATMMMMMVMILTLIFV